MDVCVCMCVAALAAGRLLGDALHGGPQLPPRLAELLLALHQLLVHLIRGVIWLQMTTYIRAHIYVLCRRKYMCTYADTDTYTYLTCICVYICVVHHICIYV